MKKRFISVLLNVLIVLSIFTIWSGVDVFAANWEGTSKSMDTYYKVVYDSNYPSDLNMTDKEANRYYEYGVNTKLKNFNNLANEDSWKIPKGMVFLGWYARRNTGEKDKNNNTIFKFRYRNINGKSYWLTDSEYNSKNTGKSGNPDQGYYKYKYADMATVSKLQVAGKIVRLYAQWGKADDNGNPIRYTVKYDPNGGTGTTTSTTHTNGILRALRKNGFKYYQHTFEGWTLTRKSDGKKLYVLNGNVNTFKTDTSKRNPNTESTVTWFKPGKQKKGYSVAVYHGQRIVKKLTEVQGDVITAKAVWRQTPTGRTTYVIDYDGNGGTGVMSRTTIYRAASKLGAMPTRESTFVYPGHHCVGWVAQRRSDGKWRFGNRENPNITAKWDLYSDDTYNDYEGYFVYKSPGQVYATSSVDTDLVTFYAQWKENPNCTINYDANGGSGTVASQTKLQGETLTLNNNSFTNTTGGNSTFIEWNTAPDGSGESYVPGQEFTLPVTDLENPTEMTLYAIWSDREWNSTYFHTNLNGESTSTTNDYFRRYFPAETTTAKYKMNTIAGDANNQRIASFTDIPEVSGYAFLGWYTEPTGGTPINWNTKTFSINSDNHVYAHWYELEITGDDKLSDSSGDGEADDTGTNDDDEGTGESEDNEGDAQGSENDVDYGDYDLLGFQVRHAMGDANFPNGTADTPAYSPRGLRFVTALKESYINKLAALWGGKSNIEYGYILCAKANVGNIGSSKLKTGQPKTKTVKCTSRQGGTGDGTGVTYDHKNTSDYRFYTMVITYDKVPAGMSQLAMLQTEFVARSYIRYIDSNGAERYFYNDYLGQNTAGGLSASYQMALDYLYDGEELQI